MGAEAESPPGAGFETIKFSVPALVWRLAGTTAVRMVELLGSTVVTSAVATPCIFATLAV
jgi:hypothetical protein